jgi:hypothetical protein
MRSSVAVTLVACSATSTPIANATGEAPDLDIKNDYVCS